MKVTACWIAGFALSACASDVVLLDDVAPLLVQCSRAVPAAADDAWRPTLEDLQAVDRTLDNLLAERGRQLGDYGRQYGGYTRDGRRFVYANVFPLRDGAGPPGVTPRIVCDGGPDYFGVEFDVDRGVVSHMAFNGQ